MNYHHVRKTCTLKTDAALSPHPCSALRASVILTREWRDGKNVKVVPYEHRVLKLIPVTGSQPAGDRSHTPGTRLPLHSARLVVTFPAAGHHHPLVPTKLYCLVTEAHVCEQLAPEPVTIRLQARPHALRHACARHTESSRWIQTATSNCQPSTCTDLVFLKASKTTIWVNSTASLLTTKY